MAAQADRLVIVGAGVGGLSAAIHARLAGFRVTVLERDERVGGRANLLARDGYRFDTGPSLVNYPWVFEDLFAAAGRRLQDSLRLLPVDPTMRFVWPDGETLTLSTDVARLAEELSRFEAGAPARLMAWLAESEKRYELVMRRVAVTDADGVLDYLRRVGPMTLLRGGLLGSMRAALRRHFKSRRVLDALGSYGMYLGGSPWELPAAFSVLPYGELAYGLWLPEGGVYALVEAMERLARDVGAEIRTSAPVRRIVAENGRVAGVEMEDGSGEAAGVIIANVDAPTARAQLVGVTARAPRTPRMTPSVATFYLALRRLPEGLGHHTIFLPDDARSAFEDLGKRGRLPDDLPFYTAVPSVTDPGLAPAGGATLFLLAPVPNAQTLPGPRREGLTERVREQVAGRLGRHGIVIAPEEVAFERALGPDDWGRRFGLYAESAFGASHTLRQIGPLRWPNRDPSIRGLYYVGASTTPGTGLPIVTLSGKMTVDRIVRDVR